MPDSLELKEEGSRTGDTLEASLGYEGKVWISIDNPWAGNTEGGFGHRTSFTLTKPQAIELARYLMEWVLKP